MQQLQIPRSSSKHLILGLESRMSLLHRCWQTLVISIRMVFSLNGKGQPCFRTIPSVSFHWYSLCTCNWKTLFQACFQNQRSLFVTAWRCLKGLCVFAGLVQYVCGVGHWEPLGAIGGTNRCSNKSGGQPHSGIKSGCEFLCTANDQLASVHCAWFWQQSWTTIQIEGLGNTMLGSRTWRLAPSQWVLKRRKIRQQIAPGHRVSGLGEAFRFRAMLHLPATWFQRDVYVRATLRWGLFPELEILLQMFGQA